MSDLTNVAVLRITYVLTFKGLLALDQIQTYSFETLTILYSPALIAGSELQNTEISYNFASCCVLFLIYYSTVDCVK